MRVPWAEVMAAARAECALEEPSSETVWKILLREGYCADEEQAKALLDAEKSRISTEQSAPAEAPSTKRGMSDITIELSPKQAEAARLVSERRNVFLSGSAGTGKSHALRTIVKNERMRRGRGMVFCTSMTNVTACEIQGTTLHAFAGIGIPQGESNETLISRILENSSVIRRWRECDLLVIDEVSMLDANLLELLDQIARRCRWQNAETVFGGIQVLLCGDFYQIPPVGNAEFCFESNVWPKLDLYPIVLDTPFRQREQEFVRFLSDFRQGIVDESFMRKLRDNHFQEENCFVTCLFAKNQSVDKMNATELRKLSHPIRRFAAFDFCLVALNSSSSRTLDSLCPSNLDLAIGAQVILTRNLEISIGLSNGTRGVVVDFKRVKEVVLVDELSSELAARCDPDEKLPVVRFKGMNEPIVVPRVEFAIFDGIGTKIASRVGIPLRLAWALTIHKSQGQTLDPVVVDLSGVFEYGQAFVALSRARSMKGLQVTGFTQTLKLAHPKVTRFYAEMASHRPGLSDLNLLSLSNESEASSTWAKRLRAIEDS